VKAFPLSGLLLWRAFMGTLVCLADAIGHCGARFTRGTLNLVQERDSVFTASEEFGLCGRSALDGEVELVEICAGAVSLDLTGLKLLILFHQGAIAPDEAEVCLLELGDACAELRVLPPQHDDLRLVLRTLRRLY
jgi:hypothetical protein